MNNILKSLSLVRWRSSLIKEDFPTHIDINVFGVGKKLPLKLILPQQVHGKTVIDLDSQPLHLPAKQMEDESTLTSPSQTGDGLITTQNSKLLAVRTADCLPILLYGQNQSLAVSLHAGWKGFSQGIIEEGLRCVHTKNLSAKDLGVFIGPAIGIEAFEIGPEVLEAFRQLLDPQDFHLCITKGVDDRWHLDLQLAATIQLMRQGVLPTSITVLRTCTMRNLAYHSFRREGVGCGHNFTTIEIKA